MTAKTPDTMHADEQDVHFLTAVICGSLAEVVPVRFEPLAAFESCLKSAATLAVGMGLTLDETAQLMHDFANALADAAPGDPAPAPRRAN